MDDRRNFYKHRSKELDTRKLNKAIDDWVGEERKRISTNGQMKHRIVREIMRATAVQRERAERLYRLFQEIRKIQARAKMAGPEALHLKKERVVEVLLMLQESCARPRAIEPEGPYERRTPRRAICIAPTKPAEECGPDNERCQGCRHELEAHLPWWDQFPWALAKNLDQSGSGGR
ncbi:hypothetical protein GOA99_18765 [Sinorhizobium meliloti]|nr:hypothetical protein [Sinorhizobium meliloti]